MERVGDRGNAISHRLLALVATGLSACSGGASGSASPSAGSAGANAADPHVEWVRQHSAAYESTDPAQTGYADLQAFGDDVGESRIVALAEQTHGGKEELQLKTRLVKYLHEEKGFDVLVIESGFFDVERISDAMRTGAKVDDVAPDNIFYMYSKSAEGRRLLQYIDSTQGTPHPLMIAGMDSQHSGNKSLREMMPMLENFLAARGSAIPSAPEWAAFKTSVLGLIALKTAAPDQAAQTAFGEIVTKLKAELCSAETNRYDTTSSGFWCQIAKSVESQAQTLWSNYADYRRDNTMGDNIIWLAEHPFVGKKIVTWSHIGHAMYDASADAEHHNAGSLVRDKFGKDYYVAQVTAYHGEDRHFDDLKVYPIPSVQAGSLEELFHSSGGEKRFLSGSQAASAQWLSTTPQRVADFEYSPDWAPFVSGLGSHWSSVFFFETVTPVTMVR